MTLPELEESFSKIDLSKLGVVHISNGVISDPQKFVDSHIRVLRGNPKNIRYKPYYDRLMELYNLITENN